MAWLTGYSYQKQITISGTTAGDQTNYQMKLVIGESNTTSGIDVHCENHCQNFPNDIRFTNANETTKHDYWIEETKGTTPNKSSTVWIEIDSIPTSSETIFYMYYGKTSDSGESNGDNTFEFFEDFLLSLNNASTYQTTPTYDSSGEAVHPDVIYFSNGWHDYKYWMVMTPYPNSNDAYENPSILVSNDGSSWAVPSGLNNPIDPQPTAGHNADTDIVYNSIADQIWVYYIECGAGTTYLKRRISSNGTNWNAEEDIFNLPDYQLISPAIVKIDSTYHMWYVDSGAAGCNAASTSVKHKTSTDGVSWSAAENVTISQSGYVIWHLDVIYVSSKSEYWMLFTAYPSGDTCGDTILFYAKSTNGTTWTTYEQPALNTSSGWDADNIYRSSFLYDAANNLLKVWYSAQSTSWHIGYTERNYTNFLNCLTSKWDKGAGGGSGSIAIKNQQLEIAQNGGDIWYSRYVVSKNAHDFSNGLSIRVYMNFPALDRSSLVLAVCPIHITTTNLFNENNFIQYKLYFDSTTHGSYLQKKINGDQTTIIQDLTWDTWQVTTELLLNSNQVKNINNNTLWQDWINHSLNFTTGYIYLDFDAKNDCGTAKFDTLLVRKNTSPEPIWGSWESEVGTGPANLKSINSITKSSIKSINIIITNIKSINTL